MFPEWLRNGSIAIAVLAMSGVHAFGSRPAEDPLLRLVPANAQIVAGIEDPHHNDQSGRLLIVTHNDNVDLRDWIVLAEVDDHQQVDRLIEVAASSERGELSEHLLLARGSFNGMHILQAAEGNGGVQSEYKGVRIVTLKPFLREEQEMRDTRWLAMLDDNTAIFGSPAMVKSALDRYLSASTPDAELMNRLSSLRPDVNCWSVLTLPGTILTRHVRTGAMNDADIALLRRVTSMSVSLHYGSKDRVDFDFDTDHPDTANALAAAISGPPHLLAIADRPHAHLEDLAIRQNEVHGSVRVADKEFDGWLASIYGQLSAEPPREDIAEVAGR
jgi:hypothetical protein